MDVRRSNARRHDFRGVCLLSSEGLASLDLGFPTRRSNGYAEVHSACARPPASQDVMARTLVVSRVEWSTARLLMFFIFDAEDQ